MIGLKWEFENKTLDLNNNSFFRINSIDGLDQPTTELATTTSPFRFGSKVQRVAIQPRIITINLILYRKAEDSRKELTSFFRAGEKGTLYVSNSIREAKIDCFFQEMTTTRGELPVKAQLVLYAEDPYFKGLSKVIEEMANVTKKFEFALEFTSSGIALGEINSTTNKTIVNESDVITGVSVEILMLGQVINPTVHNITRNEFIGVLGTFNQGDVININTFIGNKNITLNKSTNLIGKIMSSSKWIQLNRGENIIYYNADSGADNMRITVSYDLNIGAM